MDKIWHCSVIKYLQKKIGLTARDIHANIVAALEDTVALSTLQKCAVGVRRGKESIGDEQWSGRPATATTVNNVDRLHRVLMDDRRLT